MEEHKVSETPEQAFIEKTRPPRFKLPEGESYLEFLSDGEEKTLPYEIPELKMCYRINALDAYGGQIVRDYEFAMPKTLLDAVSELRLMKGGTVVGGWLKVKRVGTTKTDTKYTGYPRADAPRF